MIQGRRILALIPARGGSKGVPRKNLREVAGKPLIAWTIEEAKKSKFIDRLILSSEDQETIAKAKAWNCDVPFVRPAEMSRDESPGIDPVLHALELLPGFDYLVLLQPTSPLRDVADIDGCIERAIKLGAPACVSVTKATKSPYWMYTLSSSGHMDPALENKTERRQDLPEFYELNGAVYFAQCDWLKNKRSFLSTGETVSYVMPKERSLDIDTELDFVVFEALARQQMHRSE